MKQTTIFEQTTIFDNTPAIPVCYETCARFWPYLDTDKEYPDFYPATGRPRCNAGRIFFGSAGKDVIPVFAADGKTCHRCQLYKPAGSGTKEKRRER